LEKLKTLTNPDIHYFYPVNTTAEVKTKANSKDFIDHWRELVSNGTKITLVDWYNKIGLGNKQAAINKDEAEEISRIASLKSYEGGVKIFLIWMAEKMNLSASNKLLKLFEEPPKNTVFILICENEGKLLSTITSRCQKVYTNRQISDNHDFSSDYEVLFLDWVRAAFKVKGNKSAINELIQFSEKISKKTREEQKDFLTYCSTVFRDSFLLNYKAIDNSEKYLNGLILEKFSPFVHEENIEDFYYEVQKGFADIERNGNPKIIFLDISIKLTRLLHVKPNQNV
jgi:DNA polymerase-3 subunit delta'